MTQPSDPNTTEAQYRQQLNELRSSLLALHKTLIESERISYEQTFGELQSSNQFLQLLISDPWFAWLHPLSTLVVEIDETLDGKEPVTHKDVVRLVTNARNLLVASEDGHGFPRSYYEALQREPDVVMAHAEVARHFK